MFCVFSFVFSGILLSTNGMKIKINGVVDLGPTWNQILKSGLLSDNFDILDHKVLRTDVASNSNEELTLDETKEEKVEESKVEESDALVPFQGQKFLKSRKEDSSVLPLIPIAITKKDVDVVIDDKGVRPVIQVKDDSALSGYMDSVGQVSLKAFENLKDRTNDDIARKEIRDVARNFADTYGAFLSEAKNRKIKTLLGRQKVVLDTMETNERIVSRLLDYLTVERSGLSDSAGSVVQNAIKREIQAKACDNFKICRGAYGYSNFLVDVITEILKNGDKKVRVAADCSFEYLKHTDLSKVMDTDIEFKFRRRIKSLEGENTKTIKNALIILKNVIAFRNRPITITLSDGKDVGNIVNRTNAFLDIIDLIDNTVTPNDTNVMEWNDTKIGLKQWTKGQRNDVQKIIEDMLKSLKKKTINTWNDDTLSLVNDKIRVIMSGKFVF